MRTTVVEELPLVRSKCEPIGNFTGTNGGVGPCTYDVDYSSLNGKGNNNSRAPFNTTSERPPLSQGDPRVPGPGRYDVTNPEDHSMGIASCPFVSGSVRFPGDVTSDLPGPGEYNVLASGFDFGGTGPGYYSPNYSAAGRSNPRASHFSKYSGRNAPSYNSNPGPGTYELCPKQPSLYAQKPSSMFAAKTNRSQLGVKDTPGPGDYETGVSFIKKSPSRSLGRSAFGTSAPRFDGTDGKACSPGPGWYTNEIAPRRPAFTGSQNAYPFASTADRFHEEGTFGPGPSSYDSSKLPKRLRFGAETPFGSTVPRFAAMPNRNPALSFDDAFGTAWFPYRIRQRSKPMRGFVAGDIKPSLAPEPLPERVYDVKYDWPKPTSLRSPFGHAPRTTTAAVDNGVPGPGSYTADGVAAGPKAGNSTWGREVRFAASGSEKGGSVGPGQYHHESTFLKKSFNCTVGSDLTW